MSNGISKNLLETPGKLTGKMSNESGYIMKCYKSFLRSRYLLLIFLPGFLFYIIFKYFPMYGVIIAFKDFDIYDGFLKSPWTSHSGFGHFVKLFTNPEFYKLLRNTLVISLYGLIFGFPAPIILALSLNEVRNSLWKRTVQTISYLPHFISVVVICGMVVNFVSLNGAVNQLLKVFGMEPIQFLAHPQYFRTIYIASGIWQGMGWGSIIYLAALAGIDTQLYESAVIDGANRWKQLIHITIPGIMPAIIITLILRIGDIMDVGFQKIILLYNPMIYETADVISSFVYRRGILDADFSYSTAVNLFESIIGLILIYSANKIASKVSETSLW